MQSTVELEDRATTPPYYPYYGVHVSDLEARQILAYSIPGAVLAQLTPLPDGSYYNNRVYRLRYSYEQSSNSDSSILKVCSRKFGPNKPQNEVHVLQLIEALQPALPVPRIIAWSGQDQNLADIIEHSWILMTLLPGQPLNSVLKVEDVDLQNVFEEVASFLATLRTRFPTVAGMGNLIASTDRNRTPVLGAPVESPELLNWPKKSYLEWTKALLEEAIAIRSANDDYAHERDLLPTLSAFIEETLPNLAIFSDYAINCTSVLTNCDLSSQNILVSRLYVAPEEPGGESSERTESKLLRLTGIVDWEYAGFFSPVEEFLTASPEIFDLLPHSEDNIGDSYARFLLPALSTRGLDTPHCGSFVVHWNEAQLLYRLREQILPWWVRGLDDSSRVREIGEASKTTRSIVDELTARKQ